MPISHETKKDGGPEAWRPRRGRENENLGAPIARAHRAEKTTVRPPPRSDPPRDGAPGAPVERSAGGVRTALGVAYVGAFLLAAILPFLAFGPTGLLVLVPTLLWLAPGLRARVRPAGNLTDGVVGWPGLTALVSGAFSVAIMAVGEHAMAAAWLAALAAGGVLEIARATVATGDNLRAESTSRGPRSR